MIIFGHDVRNLCAQQWTSGWHIEHAQSYIDIYRREMRSRCGQVTHIDDVLCITFVRGWKSGRRSRKTIFGWENVERVCDQHRCKSSVWYRMLAKVWLCCGRSGRAHPGNDRAMVFVCVFRVEGGGVV